MSLSCVSPTKLVRKSLEIMLVYIVPCFSATIKLVSTKFIINQFPPPSVIAVLYRNEIIKTNIGFWKCPSVSNYMNYPEINGLYVRLGKILFSRPLISKRTYENLNYPLGQN